MRFSKRHFSHVTTQGFDLYMAEAVLARFKAGEKICVAGNFYEFDHIPEHHPHVVYHTVYLAEGVLEQTDTFYSAAYLQIPSQVKAEFLRRGELDENIRVDWNPFAGTGIQSITVNYFNDIQEIALDYTLECVVEALEIVI